MVGEKVKRDEWGDTVPSQGAGEAHELFVAPQHTNEENMKYETTNEEATASEGRKAAERKKKTNTAALEIHNKFCETGGCNI